MRGVDFFTVEMIRDWPVSAEVSKGKWVPARTLGSTRLIDRFRLAWDVFTGKADALYWEEQ